MFGGKDDDILGVESVMVVIHYLPILKLGDERGHLSIARLVTG